MRARVAALLGFVALAATAFPDVVLRGRMFLATEPTATDVVRISLPARLFLARSWAAGEWPLWAPEVYCGYPIHAEGYGGFFHPVTLLAAALLPAPQVINATVLVSMLAAALSTTLYARGIGVSRAGAFLAGAAFGFSGYQVQKLHHVNCLLTVAWIGLVFHGWECWARRGRATGLVLAGLGLGLQGLGGYPAYAYYTAVAAAGYGVWASFAREDPAGDAPRRLVRAGVALGAFAAIGLALSAVQWVPTAELVPESVRAGGVTREAAVQYHYGWGDLRTWVWPAPLDATAFSAANTARGIGAWENASYVGMVPIALAVLAMVVALRRPGRARLLAVLFVVSMLAVLETPVYDVLWAAVPGFRLFRIPARLLVLALFAAAVLAGVGLDHVRRWLGPRRGRAAAVALVALGLVDLWHYAGRHHVTVDAARWLAPPGAAEQVRSARTRVRAYGWSRVFTAMTGGLAPGDVRAREELLPPFEVYKQLLGDGAELTWDLRGTWGLTTELPLERLRLVEDAATFGVRDGTLLVGPTFARLLRLRAVEYLVAPMRFAGEDVEVAEGWEILPGGPAVWVHRLRDPLPRAWVVGGRLVARGPEAVVERLRAPGFDPARTVVLEEDAPAGDPRATGSAVRWRRDEPRAVELDVDMAAAGYLVLADSYYPGWRARVDGRAAPILRANASFRALYLPAGSHRVVFRFAPWSFRAGLAVSALAWAALVGAGLVLVWRR